MLNKHLRHKHAKMFRAWIVFCLQLITTSPVNHFFLPMTYLHLLFLSPPESQVSSLKFECDRIALLIRQKSGSMWARKLYNAVGCAFAELKNQRAQSTRNALRARANLFIYRPQCVAAEESKWLNISNWFRTRSPFVCAFAHFFNSFTAYHRLLDKKSTVTVSLIFAIVQRSAESERTPLRAFDIQLLARQLVTLGDNSRGQHKAEQRRPVFSPNCTHTHVTSLHLIVLIACPGCYVYNVYIHAACVWSICFLYMVRRVQNAVSNFGERRLFR